MKIVIGENRDIAIIKGQTTAPVVKIGSSDVTIAGFTVIMTSTEVVIQVVSLSDNLLISNNVIKDAGYGISLLPTTSKVTITTIR